MVFYVWTLNLLFILLLSIAVMCRVLHIIICVSVILTNFLTMSRDHSFPQQVFPNSAANFPHLVINFLWPLNLTKYPVFIAGNCKWQIWSVYQVNGSISDKLSLIFSIFLSSEPEWQSCISWWNHVYIQYGSLNSTKICLICPLYHHPVWVPQNSVKT